MKKIAAEKNYKLLKEAATYSLSDLETQLTKVDARLAEVEINGGKQTKLNSKAISEIAGAIRKIIKRVTLLSGNKKSGQ
jgi:hypothetical protein